MNRNKLLLAISIAAITLSLSLVPRVGAAPRYGLADSHHVWRDAAYWHSHNPAWVYRYHPEWVVDQPGWWVYDHQYNPDWFNWPFWQEYPVWEYGAYDRGRVWHYAYWWRSRYPDWLYRYHPEWAAAHAEWLREDHAAHSGWFNSPYWRDHPRDWNHPDAFYRNYATRAQSPIASRQNAAYRGQNYHSDVRAYANSSEPRTNSYSSYHPATSYQPNSFSHPTTSTASAHASSGSKHH